MSVVSISSPPAEGDFTPLSAHQEQTPQTFFGSRPVLHLQSPGAKLHIPRDELSGKALFEALVGTGAAGEGADVEAAVDVWVTSSYVALYAPSTSAGLRIHYPAITVHAQVGSAVLLELNLSDSNTTPDEDIEHLQLRLTPTSITPPTTSDATGPANGSGANPSLALYLAIGDCQELNPDPADRDSDEDGEPAFDETAPGAGGWITSENMGDFVDEDGNFRMPEGATVIGDEGEEAEPLGQGAGRVRGADEVDGENEGGKWQRTG